MAKSIYKRLYIEYEPHYYHKKKIFHRLIETENWYLEFEISVDTQTIGISIGDFGVHIALLFIFFIAVNKQGDWRTKIFSKLRGLFRK